MSLPRLATYSNDGVTRYGAVTDNGVVDISARFASDYPTLREVIDSGARFDPPRYLKPGDVVEVEAGGVGLLRNGVIDEA